MIALMILTVLVLGAASFIYYGRSSVYAQRDRLSVLEYVNGRLEMLRGAAFDDVRPPVESYRNYWVRPPRSGNTRWRFYNGRTRQRLNVNSRRYFMTTRVQYVDVDGGGASYDVLKFTVSMRYRRGSADEIKLSTYRAP